MGGKRRSGVARTCSDTPAGPVTVWDRYARITWPETRPPRLDGLTLIELPIRGRDGGLLPVSARWLQELAGAGWDGTDLVPRGCLRHYWTT